MLLQVYDAGSGALPLAQPASRAADRLYEQLDAACSGWLRSAHSLLDTLSGWKDLLVTHVVVGNSQLVPLLAKLLLTRLDGSFPLTQVYSAAAVPKLAAFKRIRAKYGPRARYIVLGPGGEDRVAADLLKWPFVQVVLGHSNNSKQHDQQQEVEEQEEEEEEQEQPKANGAAASDAARGRGGRGSRVGGRTATRSASKKGSSQKKGKAAGSDADDDDDGASGGGSGSDEEETDTEGGGSPKGGDDGAAGGEAAGGEAATTGKGGDSRSAAAVLDALGSSGHTIMDLTAQQLHKLAASLQQ